MAGISIARMELSARQLRLAASREKDGRAARRILALALVLEGCDRQQAARTCGMDRQTLRDWVRRYNADGLPGLRLVGARSCRSFVVDNSPSCPLHAFARRSRPTGAGDFLANAHTMIG